MEQEEQSIDLARYLSVLLRWWWIVALVVVLLLLIAYVYSTVAKTTIYRAHATILVQEARSGLAPGLGDIGASQQLARTYQELLTTRKLLQRTIDELGLPLDVDGLRSGVNISVRPGTSLMDVKVQGSDPESPVKIANTLTQVFIQDTETSRLADIARRQAIFTAQGATDAAAAALVEAQLSALGSISFLEEAAISIPSVRPSTRNNMLVAGFLGAFLGVLLAFLIDYSSNKLGSKEQVERMFALPNVTSPVMGVMFKWSDRDVAPGKFAVRDYPDSIYAEMYRQLRTTFRFVVSSHPGNAFMITSVAPREGKTTTLVNLASALAGSGNRIILLETDLRRPTLHRYFPETNGQGGLSPLLMLDRSRPVASLLCQTSIPGLRILACGAVPQSPADLLNSPRTKEIIDELKKECDILLLDSPPTMAASDPMILASYVDGVVIVGALGETHVDAFRDSVGMIQKSGTPIVGYILNKVRSRGLGYGRYRYHYYYYHHKEDEAEPSGIGGNGARPDFRLGPVSTSRIHRQIRHLLSRNSHRRR